MSDRYTAKDAHQAFARLASVLGKTWSDEHGKLWKGKYYKPERVGELWEVIGLLPTITEGERTRNRAYVGAWHLDHNATYGGFIVAEIMNEGGGETHPLTELRRNAREFCSAVSFAAAALREKADMLATQEQDSNMVRMTRIGDRWTIAYNYTRMQWMIWRKESSAIAFCWLESDAERIASLLNAAGVL